VTAAKTRQELGRSNLSKGKAWMLDLSRWLRESGFPGAEVINGHGRADLAGLTDWTIEAKNIADEYKLADAVDQAERDQAERGTRWHVVVKKTRGRAEVGRGLAVMTIEQWAQIARLLDERGE
jgi:hypothetical protein